MLTPLSVTTIEALKEIDNSLAIDFRHYDVRYKINY